MQVMPTDDILAGRPVDHRAFISTRSGACKCARMSLRALATASCVVTLAGCDHTGRYSAMPVSTYRDIAARSESKTPIPLPGRALLKSQPAPDCEYKPTEPDAAPAEPNADDRRKLDYERQCYRHAEAIARDRLQRLQSSVDKTIKAVRRSEAQLH